MTKTKKEFIVLIVVLVIAIILNIAAVAQFFINGHPINWSTFVCSYACITIGFDSVAKKMKSEKAK